MASATIAKIIKGPEKEIGGRSSWTATCGWDPEGEETERTCSEAAAGTRGCGSGIGALQRLQLAAVLARKLLQLGHCRGIGYFLGLGDIKAGIGNESFNLS